MNCSMCKIKISLDPKDSLSMAINDNDTYYCCECFEAKQFADFLDSKEEEIRSVEETIEKEIKEEISVVKYRCMRCDNFYSGVSCKCGFKNPLFIKKSKTKKNRK